MKKCPYCAEKIQREAIKCKHCGEWLIKKDSLQASDNTPLQSDNINDNLLMCETCRIVKPKGDFINDLTICKDCCEKNKQEPIKEDIKDNSILNNESSCIVLGEAGRWGWGWFVLLVFYANGVLKLSFPNSEIGAIAHSFILFFGLFILLYSYFKIRNRIIKKGNYGKKTAGASLKAGFLCYVVTLLFLIPSIIFLDITENKQDKYGIKESISESDNDDKNINTTYKPIRKLKVDSQYASRTIYTIQTGSIISITNAQKEFNSISRLLNKKELNFLRIEKIGNYHAVRLGKFEDYATAENLLKAIKSRLSTAIILKAYIKNGRIKMLYEDSSSDDKHGAKEEFLSSPIPEKIKPVATEKPDKKIKTDIVTENINNAEVHYERGINFDTSGKHQEAIEAFKQAIRVNPDYTEAHYNLGTIYGKLGKYQEAIDAFKQVIRIEPDNVNTHFIIGFTYVLSDDYGSAMKEYKILKELDKERANKLFNIIYP